MKHLIAVSLSTFVLFTAIAQAGNEGPAGAPRPPIPAMPPIPQDTILELRWTGGFAPSPYNAPRGIRIVDNGMVWSFRGHDEKLLANLSATVIANVKRKAADIMPSELIDSTPGQSECTDAPIKTLSVVRADQSSVVFARDVNCHHFYSNQPGAYELEQVLAGMISLLGFEE
jgi:hypothetical protein